MKLASFLNTKLKNQLEEMFFFNPRQADYREEIVHAVELFGDPKIKESSNGLTILLPKVSHAECLFSVDLEGSKLAGIVIFYSRGGRGVGNVSYCHLPGLAGVVNPRSGLRELDF